MQDTISPIAVGLKNEDKEFIAIWRLKGAKSTEIGLQPFSEVKLVYPSDMGIEVFKKGSGVIIDFPDEYMGAIVEVKRE